MSSIRCLIVAVTILLFLILFPSPVAAFYVQYEFLVNAPGDVPDAISGAELLEGVSYVDGEYEQYGSSGFGNHAQARFMADISHGLVAAYTFSHGVYEYYPYNFKGARGQVEHIKFGDYINFIIAPGHYPDGIYASMTGQLTGFVSSEIGGQGYTFSYANFGAGSYANSDLQIGNADQGTIFVDEQFTMNATVVWPGAYFSATDTIPVQVCFHIHRCLSGSVSYNTGAGYTTGDAECDFWTGMKVVSYDFPEGVEWFSDSGTFLSALSSVSEIPSSSANGVSCYPNPFNPSTTLVFELPEALSVNLQIFDLSGRLVRTLLNGQLGIPGRNTVVWNGRDDKGQMVATGTYLCRMQSGNLLKVGRMVIVQ